MNFNSLAHCLVLPLSFSPPKPVPAPELLWLLAKYTTLACRPLIRATLTFLSELGNHGPIKLKLGRSTGSNATLAFIKAWLAQHRELHRPQVKPELDPEPDDTIRSAYGSTQTAGESSAEGSSSKIPTEDLPSRLLFVGSSDSSTVRLVRRTSYGKDLGGYVALSYCWRRNEPFQLKKANVSQFERRIPLDLVSRTLHDAIHVTRALGFRYLWIDAVCIIQDSDADKNTEFPRMRQVYSNADIVIAASKAWSSSETFVTEQNALAMSPCFLGIRGRVGDVKLLQPGLSRPRSFGAIYAMPSEKYTRDANLDIRYSRMQSRGWVLQETELARRVAFFGDHQVHLRCGDCQTTTAQIKHPEIFTWHSSLSIPIYDSPDIFLYLYSLIGRSIVASPHVQRIWSVLSNQWRRFSALSSSAAPALQTSTIITKPSAQALTYLEDHHWWITVGKYSLRNLSDPNDKLPAIDGLARHVHSLTLGASGSVAASNPAAAASFSSEYIVGHWDTDRFVPGLLWYIFAGVTRRPKSLSNRQQRAPSWSWAAVDGGITNNSLSADPKRTRIEVLETPKAESAFRLIVKGALREAKWGSFPHAKKYYVAHSFNRPPYIWSRKDLERFEPLTEDPTSGPEAFLLSTPNDNTPLGFFIPDTTDDLMVLSSSDHKVFCLRIVVEPRESFREDFIYPWVTRGLALVRFGDLSDATYKRVGYIELQREQGGISFSHGIQRLDQGLYQSGTRYPPPNIDKTRFFEECEEEVISIE